MVLLFLRFGGVWQIQSNPWEFRPWNWPFQNEEHGLPSINFQVFFLLLFNIVSGNVALSFLSFLNFPNLEPRNNQQFCLTWNPEPRYIFFSSQVHTSRVTTPQLGRDKTRSSSPIQRFRGTRKWIGCRTRGDWTKISTKTTKLTTTLLTTLDYYWNSKPDAFFSMF